MRAPYTNFKWNSQLYSGWIEWSWVVEYKEINRKTMVGWFHLNWQTTYIDTTHWDSEILSSWSFTNPNSALNWFNVLHFLVSPVMLPWMCSVVRVMVGVCRCESEMTCMVRGLIEPVNVKNLDLRGSTTVAWPVPFTLYLGREVGDSFGLRFREVSNWNFLSLVGFQTVLDLLIIGNLCYM